MRPNDVHATKPVSDGRHHDKARLNAGRSVDHELVALMLVDAEFITERRQRTLYIRSRK